MSFTIGCDPELLCRREGRYVPAHNYFKSNSSFGLDGCESIAECRPGYSESPIDLTAKLRTIIEYGHEKAPQLEFYAGHYVDDHSIGGHLHFSISPNPEIVSSLDTILYSSAIALTINNNGKGENEADMVNEKLSARNITVLNIVLREAGYFVPQQHLLHLLLLSSQSLVQQKMT
jgi:hypothetical protein